MSRRMRTHLERWLEPTRFGMATLLALYLAHLYVVFHYAVDVPWCDEWFLFEQRGFPQQMSLQWALSPWNEHRIPFTKLEIWLLFQIDGWNLTTNLVVNF